MSSRVIFHIDLNCFFVSAEIIKKPSLEGLPIAIGSLNRRSVVCTANYEARKYNINAGMPMLQALNKCPNLVVIEGDYNWYKQISKRFFHYLKGIFGKLEPASIDECYIDVTDIIKQYKRPLDLAWNLQKKISKELHLPCSIGVAPNKFLAKMASDMRKPLGITVLRKSEISSKLWPLDIEKMYGVGKKTALLLKEHNIHTIGDLAELKNEEKLKNLLGKQGHFLIQNARGNDTNQLNYNQSIQSISQSITFERDINDYSEIKLILKNLSKKLEERACADHIKGKLISISIRYPDFTTILRSQTLNDYINDMSTIYETALYLFDQNYNQSYIRHLGISMGSLQSKKHSIEQISFLSKETSKDIKNINIIDELNKELGVNKLNFASSLIKK